MLVAEAVAGYLERYGDLKPLEEKPTSADQAIRTAFWKRPDVVLLDYWMPDMEGPAAAATIIRKRPKTKVILISWFHGQNEIGRAFQSGASAFLPKSVGMEDVATAIRRAHLGESPVFGRELEEVIGRLTEKDRQVGQYLDILATLSPREAEVLRLLCFGNSNENVANKLVISPGTVKDHIHNLLRKTGQAQVRQVVAMARFCGWIRD